MNIFAAARTRRLTIQLPRRTVPRSGALVSRLAGAALLMAIGLIHVSLASVYGKGAPYIGILFYANVVGAAVAGSLILAGLRGGWILGSLVSAGALVGFIASTTVGLPGFMDNISASHGIASIVAEGGFLLVYLATAVVRRNALGA